ncbi:endonuclease MutS2 [Dethiothermospora halolimnae]|uniref:endonuclease MutS2 n=1 Tax=Dethiothermospora halolimnae TaxID=3114390 RepID=UPI003CCC17A2
MNDRTLKVLEYNKIKNMLNNMVESSLGKSLVENLKPSTDIEDVKYMQNQTDEAVNIIIKRGRPPLGGIHDVLKDMKRAEIGSTLMPINLLRIADSLRAARRLKSYMKKDKEDRDSNYPILESIIYSLNTYKYIEDDIYNAIIGEDQISDNASSKLRNIRRKIESKNGSIRNKLNSIINSSTNRKYLQDALITIREDRFVVPVKQEYKSNIPGLVHDQSSSGATLFIEPMAIVELNNQLKELKLEEKEEIERILAELTNLVAQESEGIKENQKILSNLDLVFGKAKLALDMDGSKPILNNEGYINIKKGRHPLIPKDEVVPTDIYIGKKFNTLVITGPNTGGKTVTLKTVGLLTLMAQSGIQVPGEYGSHMAVFDQLFADIGDEQSIEQSLSTFSSHMTNIVDILESVDKNSLVLFDELGAGTDPTEGAALAMSILNYLHSKSIRTIATTHYSELKVYALTTEGIENASVEFNVKTLSPTYKLLIGVPGKSNAFEISKRIGLGDYIIDRARQLISKENIEFEDVLASIEKDRRVTEENRQKTERMKKEIDKLKEELQSKKAKADDMKKRIIREAKQEAKKIVREAKEESDEIVKALRDISSDIEKERRRKIQEAQDTLKGSIDKIDDDLAENVLSKKAKKIPKNLKAGETVKLLNLNQRGTVINPPNESGNLAVQVGIMKVNVHVSTVQRIKGDSKSSQQPGTKSIIRAKSKSVKSEIDVRGKTLEEAVLDVDKYLDDAYIAGLNRITIIHGKGTGILRQGISELLRSQRHVKGYRLGKHGEGGTGVTVVDLK